MKVSIVIVSYNVKDLLLACVRSIHDQCLAGYYEIIVVDNNSSDGSIGELQKQFPGCTVVRNDFNAGFSEANNQGMNLASGDYIFLLNPDTEFRNDPLSGLTGYLSDHTDTSIVAPQLLNGDGSLQVSCWKFPSLLNIIAETFFIHRLLKVSEYPAEKFRSSFDVDFASGAALMFRNELTKTTGLLDPDLFWMEDVDFCLRAKASGRIMYFPVVQIIHHSGSSSRKNYNVAISNQLISKLKYFKKHHLAIVYWMAVFFTALTIFTRLIVFSVLFPFGQIHEIKRKAYFYTAKKFYRYIVFQESKINA